MDNFQVNIRNDQPKRPFHKHWQFCVGSGHAALALRTDYVKQLKFVHEELGIKYVRFHGILNDDMHTLDTFEEVLEGLPGGDQIVERNFYLCGVTYDNILSCGMRPFVELSFMPGLLAKEKKKSKGFYGSNFNNPSDMRAWTVYIQDFIRYLLHRYGSREVEEWYFEVWNEPDLQGAFYLGTQKEYFTLYEATARAIKEVNPRLRVGGPATSGSKWIDAFVAFCRNNQVPVDFISTHQYAGDPFTGVSQDNDLQKKNEGNAEKRVDKSEKMKKQLARVGDVLPENVTCLEILRIMFGDPSEQKELSGDCFFKNSEVVKKQAEGLPVIYDEWNLMATFSAHSNDMRKAAAYDVKTAIDVEENVNGSGIWCFSDIFEEMHQFKEEFHGGFGLQTIHGIPKPTFYGMKMLAGIGEERYLLDEQIKHEIEAAAFCGKSGRDILLYRFSMKQTKAPGQQAVIRIELSAAPQEVWMERIDEEHCNPFRLWEMNGAQKDLTREEVQELIEKSSMKREDVEYSYENGIFKCCVELGVNDVYRIHVG